MGLERNWRKKANEKYLYISEEEEADFTRTFFHFLKKLGLKPPYKGLP